MSFLMRPRSMGRLMAVSYPSAISLVTGWRNRLASLVQDHNPEEHMRTVRHTCARRPRSTRRGGSCATPFVTVHAPPHPRAPPRPPRHSSIALCAHGQQTHEGSNGTCSDVHEAGELLRVTLGRASRGQSPEMAYIREMDDTTVHNDTGGLLNSDESEGLASSAARRET
jgi:hypothetical protein